MVHGGDTYGLGTVVDLSINVNPFGMPPQVVEALHQAVANATVYPDSQCRALRQAIAQKEGVDVASIVCGNGAVDLIFRIVRALKPKKALLTAPTFGEYAQALTQVGCEITQYPLLPENQFDLDDGILDAITPDLDMAFFCTPNNPTGRCIAPELMGKLANRCQQMGCYLVIDECFLELSDRPEGVGDLLQNPYVILLRAFTKSYAMAGVRLGYCLCGSEAVAQELESQGLPWGVSYLAQQGGIAACGCAQWTATARTVLAGARQELTHAMEALGLTVTPSQANYLLFYAPHHLDLQRQLLEYGILVRDCSQYPGLGAGYYRTAVALDNQPLLSALEELLRG